MLSQSNFEINTSPLISSSFKELQINRFLKAANINKFKGFNASTIFKLIFLLVFKKQNWFQLKESAKGAELPGKDVVYRFLNTSTFNWRKFLHLLSAHLITLIGNLTKDSRVKVFIVDDTPYKRERSKRVELLSQIYDHVDHKYLNGFHMLTLGWSDGSTFIPIDFSMMATVKRIITDISAGIDKRSSGFKRRKDCLDKKTSQLLTMLNSALNQGIEADYVLFDSWFASGKMIYNVSKLGLDSIGMLKDTPKVFYIFRNKKYTLKELFQWSLKYCSYGENKNGLISSIDVQTKQGQYVRIVFVMNRNKKSEWLGLVCSDTTLAADEIVRIYGYRWDIEVFFKYLKSELKLDSEYQLRNFDGTIAHASIVLTRYCLISWIRRKEIDPKTIGELFRIMGEDVRDIDFITALKSLLEIIQTIYVNATNELRIEIDSLLEEWKKSVPKWIFCQLSTFTY